MEERLKLFLAMEGLSPSQFADKLGVQRSGVSHLLSGRNKPSFEFINKMLVAYPKLNPDWLIMGTGKAYRDMGQGETSPRTETDAAPVTPPPTPEEAEAPLEENTATNTEPELFAQTSQPVVTAPHPPAAPREIPENRIKAPKVTTSAEKRIAQITILYTDGTFEIR